MALTFTKRQEQRMADVLDQQYETVEDAARAALAEALAIVTERARFTVVGQIKPQGDKFALGWYATEKQATEAALQAAYSTQTNEESRVWVLPIHNGSPHSHYKLRKDKRDDEDLASKNYREQELARRVKWFEDHPNDPIPEDWTVVIASESETTVCEACKGMGRIPDEDVPRRGDRKEAA